MFTCRKRGKNLFLLFLSLNVSALVQTYESNVNIGSEDRLKCRNLSPEPARVNFDVDEPEYSETMEQFDIAEDTDSVLTDLSNLLEGEDVSELTTEDGLLQWIRMSKRRLKSLKNRLALQRKLKCHGPYHSTKMDKEPSEHLQCCHHQKMHQQRECKVKEEEQDPLKRKPTRLTDFFRQIGPNLNNTASDALEQTNDPHSDSDIGAERIDGNPCGDLDLDEPIQIMDSSDEENSDIEIDETEQDVAR